MPRVQSSCDILVVDDDATLRSVLKTFLQRYGYVVQCAKDGRTKHHYGPAERKTAMLQLDGLA
ncbi:MAG TPA: hypothetical protein VGM64_17430 [Lacunisphaera sp.]